MTHVAVSIVAHPSGDPAVHAEMLDQCIESIRRTTRANEVRLVLTNNLSRVDLWGRLKTLAGDEMLITSPQPIGFAANHNRAVREVDDPYVFILNDDTLLLEGALDRLVEVLEKAPKLAMVGPKIFRDETLRDLEPTAGVRIMTPERTLLWRILRETPLIGIPGLRPFYSELSAPPTGREVLHLQGAAFLVRRVAYLEAGGMDEGYGMYREETDLCLALGRLGWKLRYCPEAGIIHFGGRSTGDPKYWEQYQVSLDRFLRKHYGRRAELVSRWVETPLVGGLRALRNAFGRGGHL